MKVGENLLKIVLITFTYWAIQLQKTKRVFGTVKIQITRLYEMIIRRVLPTTNSININLNYSIFNLMPKPINVKPVFTFVSN